MPIRKNKPTSAGRRFQTVLVSSDITARKPYKPLTEPLPRSGGRNNHGEITSWWRGGGHKRTYRIIDFKRDKKDIPAKVSTIEYDPNRSARIALVTYADGEKRYILQPAGLKVGDSIVMGDKVDILPGNTLPLKNIPLGTLVHNVELRPGKGGQIARSAGSAVQVVAKEGRYASVKMPSGELPTRGRLARTRRSRPLRAHAPRPATARGPGCPRRTSAGPTPRRKPSPPERRP